MDWKNTISPQNAQGENTLPKQMLTHLKSWGAITASGPDKKNYLQGQLTCNVVALDADQSTLGAHCDAKGKVWSAFRLFHHRDGYAMFQPGSAIEAELRELKKYAIFSKVELSESPDVALGVIGLQAQDFVDTLSESRGDVRCIAGGSAVKISDQRWLLLVSESAAAELAGKDLPHVDESLWKRFDIEEAIPVVERNEQNEHIPQALNLQALGGISFSKGCYTGQETVARAKYRGINKRAMYIVSGDTSSPLSLNETHQLERSVGEHWRSAGQLMAHYSYADNTAIGLIVLPNNLDADTELRLTAQPDTRWTMLPLPYSLDDE